MTYLLKNAVLVNEGRCRKGEIRIKDGKIESVCWEKAAGEDGPVGIGKDCASVRGAAEGVERASDAVAGMDSTAQAETFPGSYLEIDLKGAYVLPGIIDDQVHFRQPGLTHKGDIASESLAALKGGVTSFMDMPNTKPQTLTQELLVQKYRMGAEDSRINYSFYMGCSEDNLEEVRRIFEVTGGQELLDDIDKFSRAKAREMGYAERDIPTEYADYVYTQNNDEHQK